MILKKTDTICNAMMTIDDAFSSQSVYKTSIPFFVGSPQFSNAVNRHFQENFINNFNSGIEASEIKLMGEY